MITIIIPFYNEESKNKKSLSRFLKDLSKYISLNFNNKNKFILIDDGSRDKTVTAIEEFIHKLKKTHRNKILFIRNEKNKGYGYTLKRGFKISKTKYVTVLPSDYDSPFLDYRKFTSKNIDLVMFYRFNLEKYSRSRLLLSTLFVLIYNVVFDVKVNYIQSGCLYKLSVIKKIKVNANGGANYLSELAVKLLRSNITYTEVPISFKNKSIIDRTVSFSNFMKVAKDFILTYVDVNILNKSKYKAKAKKIYL